MAFCIPKHLVAEFQNRLTSGELTPEGLIEMGSKGRNSLFNEMFGEANGTKVNTLFESKLLLKSQQQGIINWAKKIIDMKPEAKRDLLSRVNRMEESKILSPESEAVFLNDLVNQRLGVNVTMAEASNISVMAKDAAVKRTKITESMPDGSPERMDYGRARVDFENYVGDLKLEANKLSLTEYAKPQNYLKGIENVFGFLKSMKATFDDSALGRQGLKTFFNHPEIWAKNAARSFKYAWQEFGGKNAMNEVKADILSRKNSLNGKYKAEKLAVGVVEEAFPSSVPERIPLLGRAFKASEAAFTGFSYKLRADVFDKLSLTAENTGADITGLGKFVNSLSGRGSLGPAEPAGNIANVLFFSARFVKSSIDGLTGFQLNKEMSPFVRKQGAISTMKIIGGIATILGIAKTLDPDSVEFDPRSTDFGKIKIGNTRFDVGGGMASLVILAARLLPYGYGGIKSTETGAVRQLNDKTVYKGEKKSDLFGRFVAGKFSPGVSAWRMLVDQETYFGDPLTPGRVANELLTPIMLTNIYELAKDPNAANVILASMADFFGVGTNTWGPEVDWHRKTTKEMIEFQEKKGEKVFIEANEYYNELYVTWLTDARKNKKYINATNEEKIEEVQDKRLEFKEKTFVKFNFHPSKSKKKKLLDIN